MTLSSGLGFASWQRDQHEQRGQSSHARPRLGNAPGTPDQDADCHCWTRTESLACCRQADWKLSCVGKAVQTYNSVSSAPHPSFNVTKRPRARRHMRRHPRPRPTSMSRCATGVHVPRPCPDVPQVGGWRRWRRDGWGCRLLTFSARRWLPSGHRHRGRW